MKRFLVLLLCFLMAFSLFGCGPEEIPTDSGTDSASGSSSDTEPPAEPESHYVGLTDQENQRLVVYDLDVEDWTSPEALVWEYSDSMTNTVAGIKFRHSEFWGGDVVLFCGPNGAGIIDFATKKKLWSTTSLPGNPHSVELLPNGNFICAGSSGNTVRIYGSSQKDSKVSYSDVTLTDAHGVLWDPELEVLWALGGPELTAYLVEGTDAQPKLSKISNMSYRVPGGGGHDLAPVYGNTDRLWITAGGGVYQFVKSSEKFDDSYVGGSSVLHIHIKGIGNFYDGTVAYTFPNGNMHEWTTDEANFFSVNEKGNRIIKSGVRVNEEDAYYKLRVWIPDYQ